MLENQCNPVERPCQGRGRAMPPVCVLKRLVSVPVWILKRLVLVFINACRLLWPKEVVSSGDFILLAVATSWAMSLFGIYPGRASVESCNIWVLETILLLSSWEIIGALWKWLFALRLSGRIYMRETVMRRHLKQSAPDEGVEQAVEILKEKESVLKDPVSQVLITLL